jgi:hypothetical protein
VFVCLTIILQWLPLPATVNLFKTTGAEETGSETSAVAYCRGFDSIFISQENFVNPVAKAGITKLLLHELWHIISRNSTKTFVDRCYAVFQFKRIPNGPISYPEELGKTVIQSNWRSTLKNSKCTAGSLRFTNPDAIHISHYIDVRVTGDSETTTTLSVAPLVYLQPYVSQRIDVCFCFTLNFFVFRM